MIAWKLIKAYDLVKVDHLINNQIPTKNLLEKEYLNPQTPPEKINCR
jgi:hypothetical protein